MRLTTEQQETVVENIGLVGFFISKHRPPAFIRMSDYESELMIALCEAVITWKPDGAKISTWAFHKFMGARSALIRKNLKFFRNEKQVSEKKLSDAQCKEPDEQFDLTPLQKKTLLEQVDSLSEEDKLLVSKSASAQQIGDQIGITAHAVRHRRRILLRKIAFRLRRAFPPEFRRNHAMGNGGMPRQG